MMPVGMVAVFPTRGRVRKCRGIDLGSRRDRELESELDALGQGDGGTGGLRRAIDVARAGGHPEAWQAHDQVRSGSRQ